MLMRSIKGLKLYREISNSYHKIFYSYSLKSLLIYKTLIAMVAILDNILNESPDISVEELIKLSLKNF